MNAWSSYRPPSLLLRDLGLACLGAGEQSGRLPSFSGRILNSHAIVVVSEGAGSFTVDGRKTAVIAPAIMWLFPGVVHGYGPGPSGWAEHWVLFTGPTARAFEEMGSFARERPAVLITDPAENGMSSLIGLFDALRQALMVGGSRGDLEASILTQRVVFEAGKFYSADAATRRGPHSQLLARLRETAHYPLGLSELAATLKVSPSEIRSAVQAATGVGPKEFILQLRLSRAQSLLADTAMPIQRISGLIGYDDPAYFSRLFSKKTGYSPSQFRREHRREGSSTPRNWERSAADPSWH